MPSSVPVVEAHELLDAHLQAPPALSAGRAPGRPGEPDGRLLTRPSAQGQAQHELPGCTPHQIIQTQRQAAAQPVAV